LFFTNWFELFIHSALVLIVLSFTDM
jgi:hypothetical protein